MNLHRFDPPAGRPRQRARSGAGGRIIFRIRAGLALAASLCLGFDGPGTIGRAGHESGPPSQTERQTPPKLQFTVEVDTVTLDVFVVDQAGRFVPGLTPDDFEVLEDGVAQDIVFFTAEFTPVTTLLLLDSSSSIRSSLSAIQTAAYLFVQNLSEGDRARIGLFGSDVRFGPSFSSLLEEHLAVLRTMRARGKTALYDAILEALALLEEVEGRKTLLVFTDGDDAGPAQQGSRATMAEALEAAKRSEVTFYTVGFTGWGPDGSDSVNRPFLTSLATETGGRAFFPEDVESVKQSFAQVREDLHRQYRMAYAPTGGNGPDDAWRQIEVRVKGRDDLVVRSRQGYYSRSKTTSQ